MDATHGVAAPALSSLGRSIREYSLFQGISQVMHRLRQAHPGLSEEALYEHLEFRANPSMGFPGTDIEQVEFVHEHGELRARLCINLIGLFGSASPLPTFYSEQALGDAPGDITTRDFLDLFNNRLQRLLLPIWRKYRYQSRYRPGAGDAVSAHMFALVGLGQAPLREAGDLQWNRPLPWWNPPCATTSSTRAWTSRNASNAGWRSTWNSRTGWAGPTVSWAARWYWGTASATAAANSASISAIWTGKVSMTSCLAARVMRRC